MTVGGVFSPDMASSPDHDTVVEEIFLLLFTATQQENLPALGSDNCNRQCLNHLGGIFCIGPVNVSAFGDEQVHQLCGLAGGNGCFAAEDFLDLSALQTKNLLVEL